MDKLISYILWFFVISFHIFLIVRYIQKPYSSDTKTILILLCFAILGDITTLYNLYKNRNCRL